MSDEASVAGVGSRREGRERVLGLLYESETKGISLDVLVQSLPTPLAGYSAQAADGLCETLDELDEILEQASHHWSVARMPAVDRALLRLGTWELLHRPDIPSAAVISEAVELAGEYSTDASSRFVNGVLARLAVEYRPDEPLPESDSV